MCGIAGILHADRDHHAREFDLTALRDGLRHRGPDDEGLLIDGACGLVHTRLAILDLSSRARTEILWGLLNFELWARVCTDGDGPKGVPLG
jgi:asparagine synthase (glutamine-hydrolysing)